MYEKIMYEFHYRSDPCKTTIKLIFHLKTVFHSNLSLNMTFKDLWEEKSSFNLKSGIH